jgi:choline-phosphate cytidylyltransferase
MKKVITYGTFDLFHKGHERLLKRARELGDYLIVGVTAENYDKSRGKLNVQQNIMERVENVKRSGFADEIILEEYEGQKIDDILKYKADIFTVGSDWVGKFDYLNEYCKVVYLERTKGVSSTELRSKKGIIRLGIVGNGRIADRFIGESKYVSGVNIEGVFGRNKKSLEEFTNKHKISFYSTDYEDFLSKIDAVYIATPHLTHYEFAKKALGKNIHVLCEKPITLEVNQAEELYETAKKKNLVLLEAIKTAYSPGFIRMINFAKAGSIGKIVAIDAAFTKLTSDVSLREMKKDLGGGSVTELGSYPLLAAIKILGKNYEEASFDVFADENGVDMFTQINLKYDSAVANLKVGLGAKTEGDMVVTGTKGYVYIPAPWWKTEYFEARYENQNQNNKFFYKFAGDGLRYEIADFISMINRGNTENHNLLSSESCSIIGIIEDFRNEKNSRTYKI